MTSFSNYISNTHDVKTTKLSEYTNVLLSAGHFRIPHKGHISVFEQLKKQATILNVEPIIIALSESMRSTHEPLSAEVKKKIINYLDDNVCKVVMGEDVYDTLHRLITIDKKIPVGDVLGEFGNIYESTTKRILKDCGIEPQPYTSYALTRKYQLSEHVDHVNQLSSNYLVNLVIDNNKEQFKDHYRDLELTNENILGLYTGIQQGLLIGLNNERDIIRKL